MTRFVDSDDEDDSKALHIPTMGQQILPVIHEKFGSATNNAIIEQKQQTIAPTPLPVYVLPRRAVFMQVSTYTCIYI